MEREIVEEANFMKVENCMSAPNVYISCDDKHF